MNPTGNAGAPRRGEIWIAHLGELDPARGAEIQKRRPVLIIGKDIINQNRRTVLVIPLATGGGALKANPPLTIEVHCGGKVGYAVVDQLRALDKARLDYLLDKIDAVDLEAVEIALCQVLEIG